MADENRTNMVFTDREILTIIDWFNGYCFRYYGQDPDVISKNLPEDHKQLIDRFLKIEGELPLFLVQEEDYNER